MTTLYLIRHAEAEGNLYRRIHGWYDALITDNGFRQIQALEERFRDIPVDAVYTSGLYRTMTTARAVYVPKGLEPRIDPDLREIHMGDWEDLPFGEAYFRFPEEMGRFNRSDPAWKAPNGEGFLDAGRRMEGAVRRIAQRHPDQTVAIFSHGTTIRLLLGQVKGTLPQELHTLSHSDNTAVTCLTYEDGIFRLVFESDNSHLTEEISTLAQQFWWRQGGKASDVNLWYRPARWPEERELYRNARQEAWTCTHINGPEFLAEGFLQDVETHLGHSPWGLTVAMAGEEIAGLLQLDTQRYREDGAGYIPFCYVDPSRREQSLGVQLIGQAVAFFRPLGRDKLRLRCAPYNDRAQHFYGKYGFVKVGEEQGGRVPLDILEKYIGYER
ncbi:MAG: GNAT family N-acetyltransferase [Lawsonibacter sp.]|nr:GNAT family N-acetyltransferase [Lawsonibacter sp.]